MKKHRISIYIIAVLLVVVQLLPTQSLYAESYNSNATTLTASEVASLSEFDASLSENKMVIKFKEADVLDDFIIFLEDEYQEQKASDSADMIAHLEYWGISPTDTVADIADLAQNYLDEYYDGLQLDSEEFYEMVLQSFNGGLAVDAKAEEEPEFGALYVYMCIYYDNLCYESERSSSADSSDEEISLDSNITSQSIQSVINDDIDQNFEATYVPLLLKEYAQIADIQSDGDVWPSLNGTRIQSYARAYVIEDVKDYHNTDYIYIEDGDCTNYVSQALHYGGLPMTSYVGEENVNGYTETTERWFHFNNNTSTGYSLSTSWVRVVELYDYLAPHYACGENSADEAMTPYLNKGFVLQGKYFIGRYSHSIIITLTDGEVTFCAHTDPKENEDIAVFYDKYYKCRVIQTY